MKLRFGSALVGMVAVMLAASPVQADLFDQNVSVWDSNVVGNGTTLFPIGGAGQVNGNFVVDEVTAVQVGIRASRRFSPTPLNNTDAEYFVEAGESAPGLALWNYDVHMDFGGHGESAFAGDGSSHGDFDVFLEIDVDPSLGVSGHVFELSTLGLPDTALLWQTSQNPGFGGLGFNPNIAGTYDFSIWVQETGGGAIIADADMRVTVVPSPGATLLAVIGLPVVALMRRRNG